MQDKKKIWIIIDHPNEIINAIGLSLYFCNDYRINLLISCHPYWQSVNIDDIKKYFTFIEIYPQVNFSKNFYKEIKKILYIKKKLQKINIETQDIFVSLANRALLENIIFSNNKKNLKIAVDNDYAFKHILKGRAEYREVLTSKIWNKTIIPFFGLFPCMFMQSLKEPAYIVDYKNNIFDKIILWKKYGDNVTLNNDEIFRLHYWVRKKLQINDVEEKNSQKIVIFFGEGRDYIDNYHFQFINNCLRYIEKYYPDCLLHYKPHPSDIHNFEVAHVDLGKFKIYDKKEITEVLLLNNLEQLSACFAISSLSLKSCIEFGIAKTYYFLKLYKNLPSQDYNQILLDQAGDVPHQCFIEDFDKSPQPYSLDFNLERISSALGKLAIIISANIK